MKKMKLVFLPLLLVLLAGCSQEEASDPIWRMTFSQSDAALEVYNCKVAQKTAMFHLVDKESHQVTGRAKELLLLQTEGTPILVFSGVSEEEVQFKFAYPDDTGYNLYPWYMPENKIDYILTVQPDGTLSYRIDTVTDFIVTVTTENGTDSFLLDCRRDGVEQQF